MERPLLVANFQVKMKVSTEWLIVLLSNKCVYILITLHIRRKDGKISTSFSGKSEIVAIVEKYHFTDRLT